MKTKKPSKLARFNAFINRHPWLSLLMDQPNAQMRSRHPYLVKVNHAIEETYSKTVDFIFDKLFIFLIALIWIAILVQVIPSVTLINQIAIWIVIVGTVLDWAPFKHAADKLQNYAEPRMKASKNPWLHWNYLFIRGWRNLIIVLTAICALYLTVRGLVFFAMHPIETDMFIDHLAMPWDLWFQSRF